MPTYSYKCEGCGFEWEIEQSVKDEPISECPRCKYELALRQISVGTGFSLKGSGWARDNYKG